MGWPQRMDRDCWRGTLETSRTRESTGPSVMDSWTSSSSLCAVVFGADNWIEIEEFGKAKQDWFARFLKLPGSLPSHDTFGRVFGLLGPEQFSACFMAWVRQVSELAQG